MMIWEKVYNPDFNYGEFAIIKSQSGLNSFKISVKEFVARTNIVKEFQRQKEEEQKLLGWSAKRELSKINYRIHTDAIKQNLIPERITEKQKSFIYADEADMLNVAMFGMTAKQWRSNNPDKKGNMRDYATINQLICLSNMENLNSVFINDGMSQ